MSHTALARTHRPRSFAEVSTQEHVSATLKRAVATGRVGHAYLFCGPRGVGKTTLARVLAMALNCPQRQEDGEPCGTCEDCRQIWSGTTALDVLEIDAATNRGVDDARELRDRAMYAPSDDHRHKVYIVDEAHMLTREAWNALLKVLEEPPPRVIFVFATTEPQKIEQTAAPIMSRCQRFDFRRVGLDDIVARLQEVLGREGVEASGESLHIIARKADGGMRDALSLMDQVLALAGERVQPGDVRRVLGIVEDDLYLELFDHLAGGRPDRLLELVERIRDQGGDVVEFYHGLLEALRALLRLRTGGTPRRIAPERLEDWRSRAEPFQPADLVRMLGLAAELETTGSLRRTGQPDVLLELLLLRLVYLDRTVELEGLLRTLGGDVVPSAPPPPRPSSDARTSPGGRRESASPPGSDATPADGKESPEGGDDDPAPASPAPSSVSPLRAWRELLRSSDGLPPGFGPFLHGAVVSEEGTGGLRVVLPPGPAEERLRSGEHRAALDRALAARTGHPVPLRLEVGRVEHDPSSPEERITREEVRKGLLEDLLDEEPGLRPAVKALDLEFSD